MEIYGIALFDLEDLTKLLFKFGINFIFFNRYCKTYLLQN